MLPIRRLVACCLILLATIGPAAAQTTPQPYPGNLLAYVSGGKLYVGSPGSVRLVPGPGNAFEPEFSYDGRYLAFLRQKWNGYDVYSQLWLAQTDGSDPHPVTPMGGVFPGDFGNGILWSPTADVLAVQRMTRNGDWLPIQLIPAQGTVHSVSDRLQGSFLWLPDGQTLAIAASSRKGYTRLDLVSGTSRRSYSIPGIGRYDPIKLAAWWPAVDSVVYWLDRGGCFSCIADGTPLYAFDLQTGKTHRLGVGLIYRDWITVSGNQLLAVTGRERSAFFKKHLVRCLAAGPCQALLDNRPGRIELDPSWAPDGGSMAFVVAPAWNTWGFQSNTAYWSWLDAHVLWTAQPDGSGAKPLAGVPEGAQDPQWTRDGRGILFVRHGALWLDPDISAAHAHPIARLLPAHFVPGFRKPAFQNWYYGHMDWHDLFAWY